MTVWLTLLELVAGLVLVVFFAERLVGAVVRTATGFGVSAFVVSVIFVGFDPENLAVGSAAAHQGIAGFALGSIVGAAMVAAALAFGLTAIITPMEFGRVPGQVLGVPVLAVLSSAAWPPTACCHAPTARSCSSDMRPRSFG